VKLKSGWIDLTTDIDFGLEISDVRRGQVVTTADTFPGNPW
jgi:hypothetical protein